MKFTSIKLKTLTCWASKTKSLHMNGMRLTPRIMSSLGEFKYYENNLYAYPPTVEQNM